VPLKEGLLPLGHKALVSYAPRVAQAHGEQCGFGLDPAQHDPQVMEIDLRLGRRLMGLWHISQLQRSARLGEDLWAAIANMVAHSRIRQADRVVLIEQPGPDAPRGMALLLGRIQVTAQHGVDCRLERLQPRCDAPRGLPRWRDRRFQRLAHRAPMHPMSVGQRPNRQPVDPMITTNRRILLHPRPHPQSPHLHDQRSGLSGR
jgi:hypothetical protein